MAGSDDTLRDLMRLYGLGSTPYGHTFEVKERQKFSWVAGLDACPGCEEPVGNSDLYCSESGYSKNKTQKPPKIAGYEYVVDNDNPRGCYFRLPDKKLFETVIIEPYKKQMIVEALSLVENHDLIFKKWGFEETIEKGTGVSLLFHGLPGTGKTLMAQAIADYLGKKLVTITAAEMLDKYVGETEKRIAEVFDKHKEDVIVFDECDSLLGSRESARASWEVSQVNVLLNKLENHLGVSVFTTDHAGHLDKALDRRIAVKVRFEMPSLDLVLQLDHVADGLEGFQFFGGRLELLSCLLHRDGDDLVALEVNASQIGYLDLFCCHFYYTSFTRSRRYDEPDGSY